MKQFISREFMAYRKPVFSFLISMIIVLVPMIGGVSAQEAIGTAAQTDTQTPTDTGASPEIVAALEKRVKELEQQVIDLRTMVGTYASMGRSGNGAVALPARRLASQDGASRRGVVQDEAAQGGVVQGRQAALPRQQMIEGRSGGPNVQGPEIATTALPPVRPNIREDGVVADQLGGGEESRVGPAQAALPQNEPLQDRMKKAGTDRQIPADNRDAEALYKDAYSHMLRRDYASAQSAFGSLIKNYPQSRMAGNAQYWLGETFYVRGKYRPAADAFLKAYRNYSKGIKAPDSLMKLAFSLSRLGQKGAACKTFEELDVKFPDAPNHVKQRAGMERRRMGCN